MSKYDNLIIDGNNMLFRSSYESDSTNVTLRRFINSLKNDATRYGASKVYITWDTKINPVKPNFRKGLVEYKSQRVDSPQKIEMYTIIPTIQEITNAMGIVTILPHNMEADDVVRFLCKTLVGKNVIISSDNDLLQLINDDTHMYMPYKKKLVTPDNFEEVVGIECDKFVLFKSIMGDKADNIKGLHKYGKVRAKNLVGKLTADGDKPWGNSGLDDEQIATIKNNLKVVDLSYTETIYPDEYEHYTAQLDNWGHAFDSKSLRGILQKHKLYSVAEQVESLQRVFGKQVAYECSSKGYAEFLEMFNS